MHPWLLLLGTTVLTLWLALDGNPPGQRDFGYYLLKDFSAHSYSSNGQRIFLAGETARETAVIQLGCANCHRGDGTGGVVVPDGTKSADIWRAVTERVDDKGRRLSSYMPRCKISKKDFGDLVEFMKTL